MDRIAKLRALGFREEEIERFVMVSDAVSDEDSSDDMDENVDESSEHQGDIDKIPNSTADPEADEGLYERTPQDTMALVKSACESGLEYMEDFYEYVR